MRRLLAITLALACAAALAVLGTGAGNDNSGNYQVRAIFQNAFSLVKGEDVKIAGVRVGSIESLDVTPDQQAAVVLNIERPGFQDFRKDAQCTIRPQSLIGEKFVECTMTQPRPVGAPLPPPLSVIPDGQPGAGQHLLPVTNTSKPVDIDLVNNIMRLPYRQRLGIIINEFGTGLAGRGGDLRQVIRNADPALKATDQVLRLLASQNKVLSDLAKQSAISLRPLARERETIKSWVTHSADLATATAEKQVPFGRQFELLPTFLRELRPTMQRLGSFADTATPVLTDLHSVAPDVNRLIEAQGPFASSATVALQSLGEATIPGRKALVAAKPIVGELGTLASNLKPLAKNLSALTTSLKNTGGVERLMDYLFYQVAAINGFDQYGHYLRASLILNLCTTYATQATKSPVCAANFQKPIARSAGDDLTAEQVLHMPGMSLANRRAAAVLRGMSPQEAIRLTSGETDASATTAAAAATTGTGGLAAGTPAAAPKPTADATDQQAISDLASGQDATKTGAATQTGDRLLNYLLGGGGQ